MARVLATVDSRGTPSSGPPRDAGDTHRREGPAHHGLRAGYDGYLTGRQKMPAHIESKGGDDRNHDGNPYTLEHGHYLPSLLGEDAGQLIRVGKLAGLQLLCARRRLEGEIVSGDLGARFPIPEVDGVLRPPLHCLGGHDIAAGIGAITLSDPNLPIHLLGPKGEMIAFLSVDHATAKI